MGHELELKLETGTLPTAGAHLPGGKAGTPRMECQFSSSFDLPMGSRRPVKATKVSLSSDATVKAGFAAVAIACLKHFRLNEPLLVQDRDVEALHQLRVAVRRLRTALWLFKPVTKGPEHRRFGDELKSLSRELGTARNIDIILGVLPPNEPARTRLERERQALYTKIIRKLGTKRFSGLVTEFLGWARAGEWRSRPKTDRPLMPFAAKRLDRLWRRIDGRSRHPKRLSVRARHRLRIDAKKIRYSLEFLAGPLAASGKLHRRFNKAAESLQDSLGLLNDLATGERLLGDFMPPPAKLAKHQLREARQSLGKMKKVGPYWREVRA